MTTTPTTDGAPLVGLLTVTRLVTNGLFRFLYPFLPVVADSLDVSDAQAGLLVSALALGGVAAPATRYWLTGGRERPRRLAAVGLVATGAGAVVAAGAPVLAVALLGWLVLGAGKPLMDVAAISYVSDRVPLERRARATSTMELTWAGGLVVVAPIVGLVAAATSWRVPLAALGVAALVLTVVVRRRLVPDPAAAPEASDDDEVLTVLADAAARPFLVLSACLYVALEATFAVSGLWAERAFGASIEELGWFIAIAAAGELAGAAVVTLLGDRLGKARMVAVGLCICAVGLALLPLTASLVQAGLTLGLALVGTEMAIVASIPLAAEVMPGARTRFLAAVIAVGNLARAGAALVGPALPVTVGIGANVVVSVAACVVGVLVLRHLLRRHPRLRA